MERVEAFIKENIPEAITWEIICSDKVIVNNPDDVRLNGLYEKFFISYVDKYNAEYLDYIFYKDGKLFGLNSDLRSKTESVSVYRIINNEISIYEFIENNNFEEDDINNLIFGIILNDNANRIASLRDFVTITKEKYRESLSNQIKDCKDKIKEIYEYFKLNNELLSKLVEKLD